MARTTKPAQERPSVWYWAIVFVLLLLFVTYYAVLSIQRHDALVTDIDLANVDQTIWNTANGRPFLMTTHSNMSSRLAMHFEPILLALVPLYALVPSPKTLLVIQSVALGLVAVPLYALSVRAFSQPVLALAFPLLYFLSPAVHNAALTDFHAVTLGVLPAVAALAALWAGKTRSALLFAGIALLAREDYGLWLAAFAVLAWWYTRRRFWLCVGLFGLAWFLMAIVLIAPQFVESRSSPFWLRYGFWLEGPQAWLAHGFLAEKGLYLLYLLIMGGAGALLAPLWALPALPALGLNLLANYTLPVSLGGYYSVLVFPMLLVASAIGLRRLRRRWQFVVILLLLAGSLWIHLNKGTSPLVPGFQPPEKTTHTQALPAALAELPDNASLSASSLLCPQTSQREMLRIFPQDGNCEYMMIDVLQDRTYHPMEMRSHIDGLLGNGWGVHAGQHGFLVLRRDEPSTAIPSTFYTFATASHEPEYPVQVTFGGAWELVGYDVFWDYWGRPAARLYWRITSPQPLNWQPAALAVGEDGEVLTTPDSHTPVVLFWFPTSWWTVGQTYVVEMLPFEAPGRVSLFAGVGAHLADPATRLRTDQGIDLVELATLERRGRGWHVQPGTLVP
ncbi:MAG: DUF2079 domain-containing protein [Anaerolineae bacterium]